MGVEQSNSSVVFDDRFVLKVFRKLEPGINPELELLRFLGSHGFEQIAPLQGYYEYDGQGPRGDARSRAELPPRCGRGLGLALDEIPRDAERFLDRLAGLGR